MSCWAVQENALEPLYEVDGSLHFPIGGGIFDGVEHGAGYDGPIGVGRDGVDVLLAGDTESLDDRHIGMSLDTTNELGNVGADALSGTRHSQDGDAVDEAARVAAYVLDAPVGARERDEVDLVDVVLGAEGSQLGRFLGREVGDYQPIHSGVDRVAHEVS